MTRHIINSNQGHEQRKSRDCQRCVEHRCLTWLAAIRAVPIGKPLACRVLRTLNHRQGWLPAAYHRFKPCGAREQKDGRFGGRETRARETSHNEYRQHRCSLHMCSLHRPLNIVTSKIFEIFEDCDFDDQSRHLILEINAGAPAPQKDPCSSK